MRYSRAHALVFFGSGLLLGAALVSASFRAQLLAPEQDATRPAISKVAGWDTGADAEREQRAGRDAREQAQPAAPPAPSAEPATLQKPERRPASEIARRALGFTVFVRGGRVYGAGVLLDRAGHVLTCNHVIEGLDQIEVSFSDGASYPATVLEKDPVLDVALLKIGAARKPELTAASVTSVELGDDLFAIGAPRKMAFSLSRGMASFVGRPFGSVYYLQTDLAMNAGSSGGPIMNDRGDVIAISSFVLRNSEGLAFALPIDYAYRRFRNWLETPKALEGSLNEAFEGWLTAMERARVGAARPN